MRDVHVFVFAVYLHPDESIPYLDLCSSVCFLSSSLSLSSCLSLPLCFPRSFLVPTIPPSSPPISVCDFDILRVFFFPTLFLTFGSQARARALHLRAFLLKLAKIRSELNAKAKQKRLAGAKTVKGKIKAYERKGGPVAVIQQRLMACFDSVVDAFVYADLDGNDRISQYEFKTAMRKLFMNGNGIDEQTVSKVAVMIAGADKFIDPHEFFRTFAWHNIGRVEEAFQDAKMSKSCIVARVKERLTTFFGRTSSTDSQI